MSKPIVINAHTKYATSVVFSPDGKRLISGGFKGEIREWDVKSWDKVREFKGHKASINSMQFSQDENSLITSSSDKTARIWDYETAKVKTTIDDHKPGLTTIQLSPDQELLIGGGTDGRVVGYSYPEGKQLFKEKQQPRMVTSLAYSPNGKDMVSGGLSPNLYLWDLANFEISRILENVHDTAVIGVLYFAAGDRLLSVDYAGNAIVWSMPEFTELVSQEVDARFPVISPDGSTIAMVVDYGIKLYDPETLRLMGEIESEAKKMYQPCFSPDGKMIAVPAADSRVRIWFLDPKDA